MNSRRATTSNAARDPIPGAIDVFAHGFAAIRSITHPYLVERAGKLRLLRDAPRKNALDYRVEEWIAYRVPPDEVDRVARRETRGRFAICAIIRAGDSDQSMRADYKRLGYRLGTTEPMMMHRLRRIPKLACPVKLSRVSTQELADQLAAAAGRRMLPPEHIGRDDAPFRVYVAMDGDRIVGWVGSITVGEATWVQNMQVIPSYRRRGIARAMLSRLLRDDRAHGSRASVLLASHTGALLYPVVGYEQIGTLYLFTPKRK